MRGEDTSGHSAGLLQVGSPPHARGRRVEGEGGAVYAGITPACAGKTATARAEASFSSDHPRMRGEDEARGLVIHPTHGSPPHARGRHFECKTLDDVLKITPACAGKTPASCPMRKFRRDHPRMRGEDALTETTRVKNQGSPPHARGRRNGGHPQGDPAGITPACAGKTAVSFLSDIGLPDHPRMRGEDPIVPLQSEAPYGSPPHARGRLLTRKHRPLTLRITPACAGRTKWH